MTSFRVLTWCSIILLAVLSLLPAQKMMRSGLPGRLEHFVAYAGSATVAMAGYGASRGGVQIIGGFWVYAGILEYLQHFSAGRHPSIADFAASAVGALCGGLAIALLARVEGRLLPVQSRYQRRSAPDFDDQRRTLPSSFPEYRTAPSYSGLAGGPRPSAPILHPQCGLPFSLLVLAGLST